MATLLYLRACDALCGHISASFNWRLCWGFSATQLLEGVEPSFVWFFVCLVIYVLVCLLLAFRFIACLIALDFAFLLTPFWIFHYFAVVGGGDDVT